METQRILALFDVDGTLVVPRKVCATRYIDDTTPAAPIKLLSD